MARAMDNFKRTSEDVQARALVTPILHGVDTPSPAEDTPGPQALNEPDSSPHP